MHRPLMAIVFTQQPLKDFAHLLETQFVSPLAQCATGRRQNKPKSISLSQSILSFAFMIPSVKRSKPHVSLLEEVAPLLNGYIYKCVQHAT